MHIVHLYFICANISATGTVGTLTKVECKCGSPKCRKYLFWSLIGCAFVIDSVWPFCGIALHLVEECHHKTAGWSACGDPWSSDWTKHLFGILSSYEGILHSLQPRPCVCVRVYGSLLEESIWSFLCFCVNENAWSVDPVVNLHRVWMMMNVVSDECWIMMIFY